jgi:hypothetical protein
MERELRLERRDDPAGFGWIRALAAGHGRDPVEGLYDAAVGLADVVERGVELVGEVVEVVGVPELQPVADAPVADPLQRELELVDRPGDLVREEERDDDDDDEVHDPEQDELVVELAHHDAVDLAHRLDLALRQFVAQVGGEEGRLQETMTKTGKMMGRIVQMNRVWSPS